METIIKKGALGREIKQIPKVTMNDLKKNYSRQIHKRTILLFLFYPLIARLTSLTLEKLSDACVSLYNINEKYYSKNIDPNIKLILGASWPISGVVLIPILVIAFGLGLAFSI